MTSNGSRIAGSRVTRRLGETAQRRLIDRVVADRFQLEPSSSLCSCPCLVVWIRDHSMRMVTGVFVFVVRDLPTSLDWRGCKRQQTTNRLTRWRRRKPCYQRCPLPFRMLQVGGAGSCESLSLAARPFGLLYARPQAANRRLPVCPHALCAATAESQAWSFAGRLKRAVRWSLFLGERRGDVRNIAERSSGRRSSPEESVRSTCRLQRHS